MLEASRRGFALAVDGCPRAALKYPKPGVSWCVSAPIVMRAMVPACPNEEMRAVILSRLFLIPLLLTLRSGAALLAILSSRRSVERVMKHAADYLYMEERSCSYLHAAMTVHRVCGDRGVPRGVRNMMWQYLEPIRWVSMHCWNDTLLEFTTTKGARQRLMIIPEGAPPADPQIYAEVVFTEPGRAPYRFANDWLGASLDGLSRCDKGPYRFVLETEPDDDDSSERPAKKGRTK